MGTQNEGKREGEVRHLRQMENQMDVARKALYGR